MEERSFSRSPGPDYPLISHTVKRAAKAESLDQWVGKDGDSLDFAYLHRKPEKRAEEEGRAKHM